MNAFMSLSPEFQRKATVTAALSYRQVSLNAIYQRPDSVDIVQEMEIPFTDRVETGLDAAVLIRACLENPKLLPYITPFLREINDRKTQPGQEVLSDGDAGYIYGQIEEDGLTVKQKDRLERRASAILDEAFKIASKFPAFFAVDFKTSARRNGRFVPTKADNIEDYAAAKSTSPLGYLKRTREFHEDWIMQIEGTLNQSVIRSYTLANEPESLKEAEEYLERRYAKLQVSNIGFWLN